MREDVEAVLAANREFYPAFADRVFRLFERLDPSLPGTGVGLAIVRRVVELHGGSVALRSRGIGEGCVVEIELPGEGSDR